MAYVQKGTMSATQIGTSAAALSRIQKNIQTLDGEPYDSAFLLIRRYQNSNASVAYYLYGFTINDDIGTVAHANIESTLEYGTGGVLNYPQSPLGTTQNDAVIYSLLRNAQYTNCSPFIGGGVWWSEDWDLSKNPPTDAKMLIDSDFPIFSVETTGANCEEAMQKILPYLQYGDYSGADNAEELDLPKIDFFLNLDTDSDTATLNWNISPSDRIENLSSIAFSMINPSGEPSKDYYCNPRQSLKLSYGVIAEYANIFGELSFFLCGYTNKTFEEFPDIYIQEPEPYWITWMMKVKSTEITPQKTYYESVNGKNTLTIKYGKPDEDSYTSQEDSSDSEETFNNYGGANTLTTTYRLNEDTLKSLGNFMWNGSFFDTIKLLNNSPIENIVSVKSLPFTFNTKVAGESIKIGNTDTGLKSDTVGQMYKWESKEFEIPVRDDGISFLDYSPYTSISIYLPFIGVQKLNNEMIMGRKIKVTYIADCLTGSLTVTISIRIKHKGKWTYKILDVYNGTIGIDIPITASNRAQVDMSYVMAGVGFAASAATLNGGGMVSSLNTALNTQFHSNSKGSPSPLTSSGMPNDIFIMVVRPITEIPSTYGQDIGRKCGLTRKLGNLKGFTKCIDPDISNLDCTWDIKNEILDILNEGIYIK